METISLHAEVRNSRGKGPTRKLRRAGHLPAVLYGPHEDPTPVTIAPKELLAGLKSERGRNSLFEVLVGDRKELAMVKDVAVDPVTRHPLHVDLYKIDLTKPVRAHVPFSTTGRAVGVQQGGILNIPLRTVPVRSTPDRIPVVIEADVSNLGIHETVSVADLKLPEGVEVMLRPQLTLAIVLEGKKSAAEATAEEPDAS